MPRRDSTSCKPNRPITGFQIVAKRGHIDLGPELATHWKIRMLPPGAPDDDRADLDIPLDKYLFKLILVEPRHLSGYVFSLVGAFPPPETTLELPWFNLPPLPPPYYDVQRVVIYGRHVLHKDTPVYLEWYWHPERGERLEMKGIEHDLRQSSVLKVHRGIELLRAIEASGRPLGSLYYPTREAFHEACKEKWKIAKRRYRRPTITHLIELLPIERTAYYNHVTVYGPPPLD